MGENSLHLSFVGETNNICMRIDGGEMRNDINIVPISEINPLGPNGRKSRR